MSYQRGLVFERDLFCNYSSPFLRLINYLLLIEKSFQGSDLFWPGRPIRKMIQYFD